MGKFTACTQEYSVFSEIVACANACAKVVHIVCVVITYIRAYQNLVCDKHTGGCVQAYPELLIGAVGNA